MNKELQETIVQHANWLAGKGGACANLSGADLSGADLRGADLSGADLRGADLRRADLSGADLSGADLWCADLSGANLQRADLSGADLRGADLRCADLTNSKSNYLTCGIHSAPEGELIGWKKLKNGTIAKLLIPREARRSCATTRKHRAEWVVVLEGEGETNYKSLITKYAPGQTIKPDSWDADRWHECSHGIHFFLTRQEAEVWNLKP